MSPAPKVAESRASEHNDTSSTSNREVTDSTGGLTDNRPSSSTVDEHGKAVSANPNAANSTANIPVADHKLESDAKTEENKAADIAIDVNTDGSGPPKEPIPSAQGWSPKKKSWLGILLFVSFIVIGVLLILYTWKLPPFIPTVQHTDNAFIKGRTTVISPQIAGYVTQVMVNDFASVKAGDVLVKLDDRNFKQQLEQAQANIEVAMTDLSTNEQDAGSSQAQINARLADLNSAKVSVASAAQDVARYEGLDEIGAVSKAEVMHTRAQLAQAQAAMQQAQANLQAAIEAAKKTSGSKASLDAKVQNAEAAAKQAQINLDNTVISAPESGQLSQVSVKPGQYVSAGTQLMYIVPDGVWVIANFKETQVENIHIGEPANIRVDALGGQTFTGHVSNISPATGSEFSAGANNPATGNYIKVAQRIPVRIDLDANQSGLNQLRPGMSVTASVDTESNVMAKRR